MDFKKNSFKISIIGLGYVGLPLAVEFAKKYETIGFDIDSKRIEELNSFFDITKEVDKSVLKKIVNRNNIIFSSDLKDIEDSNIYIVSVPTPVDKHNHPDFYPLISASKTVSTVLKKNDIVIYESTVYPGATEEICVPVLEENTDLIYNKDFFIGYSPERINPGDKVHSLTNIVKVTSGSTEKTADIVDFLYSSIIDAGTHKTSSISIAEASKVIENAQRDINIAFVNELAKIFSHLKIDTKEVLSAAKTKWNFLNFSPGLVGGHCIGVDPYYLAQKAIEAGYNPEIILSGRRINDSMGKFIATELIKLLLNKDLKIKNSNILILGFTFKENCPDIRNTKVIDIVNELKSFNVNLTIVDPLADINQVFKYYGLNIYNKIPVKNKFDAALLAVAHNEFMDMNFKKFLKLKNVIYDVKSILDKKDVDARL